MNVGFEGCSTLARSVTDLVRATAEREVLVMTGISMQDTSTTL
jgi:hypothetical protein